MKVGSIVEFIGTEGLIDNCDGRIADPPKDTPFLVIDIYSIGVNCFIRIAEYLPEIGFNIRMFRELVIPPAISEEIESALIAPIPERIVQPTLDVDLTEVLKRYTLKDIRP